MDQRQNDRSFRHEERGRGRDSDRNQRFQQSGRDFYPGNYGFDEGEYGTGQSGRGQYGYGGSGGSTYGASGYGPYAGERESGGSAQRERWGEQRDYYGQGEGGRWDEQGRSSSGYYR